MKSLKTSFLALVLGLVAALMVLINTTPPAHAADVVLPPKGGAASLFLQAGQKAFQYTNGPWYTRPSLFRVIDYTGTNHFGLDTNGNFFYVSGGLTNATAYNGFVTFSNAAGPKILFFRNGVMFSTNYSGQAF